MWGCFCCFIVACCRCNHKAPGDYLESYRTMSSLLLCGFSLDSEVRVPLLLWDRKEKEKRKLSTIRKQRRFTAYVTPRGNPFECCIFSAFRSAGVQNLAASVSGNVRPRLSRGQRNVGPLEVICCRPAELKNTWSCWSSRSGSRFQACPPGAL